MKPTPKLFPDLIFLINFSDTEYSCIEYWLSKYRRMQPESADDGEIISLQKFTQ